MKKLTLCIGLAALPVWADFSYQEKSQMTGGAAVNMMKALGPFMKKARERLKLYKAGKPYRGDS